MLKAAVAALELTSVTLTVKLLVPLLDGVPVMAPLLAFKLRPAGRLPTVMDHVYGVTPPLAARLAM
jgi:hypothetical protein